MAFDSHILTKGVTGGVTLAVWPCKVLWDEPLSMHYFQPASTFLTQWIIFKYLAQDQLSRVPNHCPVIWSVISRCSWKLEAAVKQICFSHFGFQKVLVCFLCMLKKLTATIYRLTEIYYQKQGYGNFENQWVGYFVPQLMLSLLNLWANCVYVC